MMFDSHIKPPATGGLWVCANFVQTIDGKTAVRGEGADAYWPLGSEKDYELLTELRAQADILIHGSRTAAASPTFARITSPAFLALRKQRGKNRPLAYHTLSRKNGTPTLKCLLQDLVARHNGTIILLEGGPTTFGGFLAERLVDDLFLTIAPKILGSSEGKTLTLVEGVFFAPDSIIRATLASTLVVGDEVFLRYSL